MNCLEFRRIVGADPNASTPELTAHEAQCPACARYRQQMQEMDRLIHRALAVDTDAPSRPMVQRRRTMQWGLAASALLAVVAGFLWIGYPRETLAEQVVQHMLHEPHSLQASEPVSEQTLNEVLAQSRVRLKPGVGPVTYASSCPFRGHQVPHFVVQTAAGPVTVLLLREERHIAKPQSFKEGGFVGVIMPAPHGVLAVLGQNAPVAEVARKVLAAVEYET